MRKGKQMPRRFALVLRPHLNYFLSFPLTFQVQNTASIGERKNMNLPGAIVNLPTLTEKDVADLTDFGVPQNVDFIAASFVRKGADIDYIRSVLGEQGAHIKIIAKIEARPSFLPSLYPSLPPSRFLLSHSVCRGCVAVH